MAVRAICSLMGEGEALRTKSVFKRLLSPALSSISWKRESRQSTALLHFNLHSKIEFEMNLFHPPNEAGHALR